jgi:lia operon protein LiaG
VRASDTKGSASVATTFGPVLLAGVSGPVTVANQNGSVEVAINGNVCQPIDITTSFAPVRIQLPDQGGYRIAANTSFGKISSALPIAASGNLSGNSIAGTIGNGQCPLKISNTNGDIELQKR